MSLSPWLWVDSGQGGPAFNMAFDEALLEAMPRLNRPVLRFYGWIEPAASFGYFQKYSDVDQLAPLRPLVRRPTGGGLVPHDADWTYSLAFPTGHEWYSLQATESYRRMHAWIQAALERLGIQTTPASEALPTGPGCCFVGYEQHDLLWHGQKIAGAAQRRRRDGLLIQGSIQPGPLPSIRADWQAAMVTTAPLGPPAAASTFEADAALNQRISELAIIKYSQQTYNRKR
jgi:lipoyl(octanoyl) transferase